MDGIETTIRDGTTRAGSAVAVSADAEPDVGIMSQFVEDVEVTFLSGHPVPGELSDEDDHAACDELVAAYNEPPIAGLLKGELMAHQISAQRG